MDFENVFPLRYWINLGRRDDRRAETEWRLEEVGLSAKRFPAIDARFVRNSRGYENKGRYALALTIRMAIRRAKEQNAPAVLLLEDDVILHPNFLNLIDQVDLPEDWGIFYLGCQHSERPKPIADNLVRVVKAFDSHAWAISANYYDQVMDVMDFHGKPRPDYPLASDQAVAMLHRDIPTYACYPNLAWQAVEKSDLTGTEYSLYGSSGSQKNNLATLESLMEECIAPEILKKDPKLGLLFLTRCDLHQPEIWAEWVAEAPESVRVFSHIKDVPDNLSPVLHNTLIPKTIPTAWGEVSLVQATRLLLQEALMDDSITHFALVSESCVPVRPLPEILFRLRYDPRCQFGFKNYEDAHVKSRKRAESVKSIPTGSWRFTSQWWLLNRAAAKVAIKNDYTDLFRDMFAPDESYFGTVLALEGYPVDDLVINTDITWTYWDWRNAQNGKAKSPSSFERLDKEHLVDILHGDALFARKFPPGADIGKYRLHVPRRQAPS